MDYTFVLQPTISRGMSFIQSINYTVLCNQNINECFYDNVCCYDIFSGSESLLMFSILDLGRNDSGVAGLEAFWTSIEVLIRRNELSLIVTASITNHDLGRILVRHHDRWLGQSASESIGMVWLQWLLEHASMEIISDLELVLREGSYFW